ncbi:hypothetical protein MMC11_004550 [Xylographa trunciseda]|nr:hypothetical protein [Xylographa trunciseda]
MADCQEASDSMKSNPLLVPDLAIVDYELEDERDASEYQVIWSNTMDKGPHKSSSTYRSIDALLLCWTENSNDMATEKEVLELKSVLVDRFGYNVQIQYLDKDLEKRLQVQVNAIVAKFVGDHDGPNKLLMVYYAGHGRPGEFYGSLELIGQTSPNDKKKRIDALIWNKTEELLKVAEADVLEIFDWHFEYLAATGPMHGTPVPGKDSFTSALVYALNTLYEEKEGGRFTTVELLNKIKSDAPYFLREQIPVLSDRKDLTLAGRIMLHPITNDGSISASPLKDPPSPDPTKRHTLTLHFDFGNKPTKKDLEKFGLELNDMFERFTFGVHRVRWGGMRSAFAMAAKMFQRGLSRSRRSSTLRAGDGNSPGRPDPGLARPSSDHLSPSLGSQFASQPLGPPGSERITPPVSVDSNGEATDLEQPPRRKRKTQRQPGGLSVEVD